MGGKIVEALLEIILTVLCIPFGSKYEDAFVRTKGIHKKGVRICLKILLILIPFVLILGLCCLCSYLF